MTGPLIAGAVGILLFLPVVAGAQATIPFYEFGSVGVDYPADAQHPNSLQGIGGQTFATVDPPTNTGQNLAFAGFFQTGVKYVYKGTVTLQQFGGNVSAIPLTLRLWNNTGDLSDELSGFADSAGKFTVMSWANPSFNSFMSLKGSHWLRHRVATSQPANPITGYPMGTFSLINGDVTDDNAVDVSDLSALADAFFTSPGDTSWNPDADLNGDSSVDIQDLSILADNFFQDGDE